MHDIVVPYYKQPGITPLQALKRFRIEFPDYENERLSYAGRLDPMAEGLLLILVGKTNNRRAEYLHLPKTYEFEVLIGISTDTYDVMGNIQQINTHQIDTVTFQSCIKKFHGDVTLPYPAYSSRTVNGKPLHWYANNSLLQTINIPTFTSTIDEIACTDLYELNAEQIQTSIHERITAVEGNFRQEQILASWKNALSQRSSFQIARCTASVSSGTYIRSIVHALSTMLTIPMIAYTIKRTHVGPFTIYHHLLILFVYPWLQDTLLRFVN